MVVTRFAPSPTGYLHIGGARTALFNWLFAKSRGGKFVLRIEDTDRDRSDGAATEAIFDSLSWLGLDWDGEAVSQFSRRERHAEVASALLASGHAYRCWSTAREIEDAREEARAAGRPTLFQSPWRDRNSSEAPRGEPFAVRVKAPREGRVAINDAVQGVVEWPAGQLDDMILLRSDGTPTYMLAVVVDDHDMEVTHVIRGDDHLNNAARQKLIYDAMGWEVPVFAHIPLIHGADGKKLSKRHGALGVGEYRAMGYPAAAMRNHLARLGWSHGDEEVFTTEQAIGWFGLDGVRKAPARFDPKKLESVSKAHIGMMDDEALLAEIEEFAKATGREPLAEDGRNALLAALPFVKNSVKTLPEALERAHFALAARPIAPDEQAARALDPESKGLLDALTTRLKRAKWTRDGLELALHGFAEDQGLKFGKLAQPIRAALAGRSATPSVFDMMVVLGRGESLARLEDAAN